MKSSRLNSSNERKCCLVCAATSDLKALSSSLITSRGPVKGVWIAAHNSLLFFVFALCFVSISLHHFAPMNGGLLYRRTEDVRLSWRHRRWRNIYEVSAVQSCFRPVTQWKQKSAWGELWALSPKSVYDKNTCRAGCSDWGRAIKPVSSHLGEFMNVSK